MKFLVISNKGIWTFDMFLDAWNFCNESFFGKGDWLCISENTALTKEIERDREGL